MATTVTHLPRFGRCCAALALVACSVNAQSIRGRVESDVTKELLPGAVVVAEGVAGHLAPQPVITDERGEFTLRFASSGQFTVSVRRIGYRPVDLSFRVDATDTTLTVRMSPLPLRLAVVKSVSRGQCRVRPTNDSTLWAMWSAAEVAMLNANIARETGAYQFDAEFSERTYEIRSSMISDVSLRDTVVIGARPWTSLPSDSLDRAGFVSANENHMTFVGPDLSALLSPGFLDNHCIAIHRGTSDDSSLVGLDFVPTSASTHIDIRGTFWLERTTAELQALTFYYDRLPYVGPDTLAGGRIEFAHLSSGAWVLTHWSIRAPLVYSRYLNLIASQYPPDAGRDERAVNSSDPKFGARNVQVSDGRVRSVRRTGTAPSPALWTAPVSTLTVHVRAGQADSMGTAFVGAIVRLRGSNHQVISDKNGDATFPDMLPGEYILDAASPAQDLLELPPDRIVVVVRPPMPSKAEALVMSEATAIHTACGAAHLAAGVLAGRVIRNGYPADDETISVVSSSGDFRLSGVKADSAGRFRVCGVPKGETLLASVVSRRRVRATARVTISLAEQYGWVRLDLEPPAP